MEEKAGFFGGTKKIEEKKEEKPEPKKEEKKPVPKKPTSTKPKILENVPDDDDDTWDAIPSFLRRSKLK